MTTLHSLCDFCKFGSNCTCTATIVAVQPTPRYTPSGEHYDLCSQYRIDTACCVDLDASRTVSRPIVVQRLGLTIVDLRGVPLAVSTLWAGDSLVNRRTYTLARGPVFGAKQQFPWGDSPQVLEGQ